MKNTELKNALLLLGLSQNEIEVYLILAGLGACTSGPIIEKTGLHRNVVYTALEHLIARKYVVESQARGKKQFVLADPEVIFDEFRRKADIAEEVSVELAAATQRQKQEITIHEDNDEYLSLLLGLMRSSSAVPKVVYVLGTGGEAFMKNTMRPLWRKYHKVAREEGIHIRMISYESQRDALQDDVAKDADLYDVRYLPDDIENPAGMQVYPWAATILNVIYSTDDQPVSVIRIKNADLAEAQLHLFTNLWKIAKV